MSLLMYHHNNDHNCNELKGATSFSAVLLPLPNTMESKVNFTNASKRNDFHVTRSYHILDPLLVVAQSVWIHNLLCHLLGNGQRIKERNKQCMVKYWRSASHNLYIPARGRFLGHQCNQAWPRPLMIPICRLFHKISEKQ